MVAAVVVAEEIRSHRRFYRDTRREVTVLLRPACKGGVGVCGVLVMVPAGVRMEGMNILSQSFKVSLNQSSSRISSNSNNSNATLPHDHCGGRATRTSERRTAMANSRSSGSSCTSNNRR